MVAGEEGAKIRRGDYESLGGSSRNSLMIRVGFGGRPEEIDRFFHYITYFKHLELLCAIGSGATPVEGFVSEVDTNVMFFSRSGLLSIGRA